ncbi:transposase [Grimontia hollisae]|uniref:transposase n=1 Tax=Grimontia hollisae TaxID=673 RepID=UPI001E3666FF|nr:transposase [Grimontia hollisae]
MSDAGFRNTWFRQVQSKGWFWLGRVRGDVSIKMTQSDWQSNKTLYPDATSKPHSLGQCQLARRSPLTCNGYVVKQQKAQRHSRTGQKHTASRLFAKNANEPWLLVTNIPTETLNAVQICRLYAKRMQIEEAFRDLKSTAYGLALRHNRTHHNRRLLSESANNFCLSGLSEILITQLSSHSSCCFLIA